MLPSSRSSGTVLLAIVVLSEMQQTPEGVSGHILIRRFQATSCLFSGYALHTPLQLPGHILRRHTILIIVRDKRDLGPHPTLLTCPFNVDCRGSSADKRCGIVARTFVAAPPNSLGSWTPPCFVTPHHHRHFTSQILSTSPAHKPDLSDWHSTRSWHAQCSPLYPLWKSYDRNVMHGRVH